MPRPETVQRWRQRIQRFDLANMSVAQFCQSEGVSQPSFYQWKKTIRQTPQQPVPLPASPESSFKPLRLATSARNHVNTQATQVPREHTTPPITSTTIELPGGVRIRVEVPSDSPTSRLDEDLDEDLGDEAQA